MPNTRYLTNAPNNWTNVTIRRLLTHNDGFTDYQQGFDFRQDYTEDELLKRIAAVPLAFPPGEKRSCSNLGYVTLGILIHKVSGKFYGDLLQERIFGPLGMNTACIISEADVIPNRAAGYRLVEGKLKNQKWVSPSLNTTADGSLYLSTLDMAKWDAALDTDRLLKQSSWRRMWTPVKLNNGTTHGYGFGWSLGEVRGYRILEHGGSWQGFGSYIARYPDERLTVVVVANLASSMLAKIAHTVGGFYSPELAPPPAQPAKEKE
jgi:CubicO group peptidase (beta-lactamase class C family)